MNPSLVAEGGPLAVDRNLIMDTMEDLILYKEARPSVQLWSCPHKNSDMQAVLVPSMGISMHYRLASP